MAKKIVLRFKDGKVDMDMDGFTGTACSEAMERNVAQALLNAGTIEEKAEFYSANVDLEEARILGYEV